tara:strand:+ start:5615 stop:6940 length:1326 start_codon:yes stop_codon:yes gene_type:complete
MIKHSQQSKGFMPTKSGPNLSGFYMGNSSNLMQMYQTGGQTSRGAARLAQATQRQSDIKRLEQIQRQEAKRQQRGGLFGSIGQKGLGIVGSIVAGPAGAAIGSALGKRLGEGIGSGKSRQYDRSGTIFAQQDFRDVNQASKDFNEGMGQRAVAAGFDAGLQALTAPGGGIYGAAARKAGGLQSSLADLAGFGGAPLPVAPSVERIVQEGASFGDPSLFSDKIFDPSSVFPASTYNPMASPADTLLGASDYVPETFSLTQATPTFYEDGGLVEYQYGGGVGDIQQILQDAGIQANTNQLALFEQFDPSSLNELASGLQSSLLSGTKQIQTQQAGTGFSGSGVTQEAQKEQREIAMGQLETAQERAARGFESQTLGDAASMIDQGAEFGSAPPPTVSTLPTADQGDVTFNGTQYVWDSETGRYITMDEYEQSLADQQSDIDYG